MFSCENIFLGKLFWYQVHFDMHVRTHTREHLYYCSQCHYSSITKNCLKRHVIQKHSNILLKCPTDGCDYSTPDKYKLQAHLKVHTELVSSKPEWQPNSPECSLVSHSHADVELPASGLQLRSREILFTKQTLLSKRLPSAQGCCHGEHPQEHGNHNQNTMLN